MIAPLLEWDRVRVPLLWFRAVAYGVGAGMMTMGVEAKGGILVGVALGLQSVFSLVALATGFRSVRPFAIGDIVTVALSSAMVGLNPATVQLLLVVDVVAVLSVTDRRSGRIVVATAIGAVAVLYILAGRPVLVEVSPAVVARSEVAAGVLGLVLAVAVLRVMFRAIQSAADVQTETLERERINAETQQRFLAMVSHELRTPLTSIRGFASILRADLDDLNVNDAREFVEAISDQSEHLSRLVDDVLVVLRLESGTIPIQSGPVDVVAMFSSLSNLVDPGGQKTVLFDPGPVTHVITDRDRLTQVLRNLIENAIKYGGARIEVAARPVDDEVEFTVSDNGDGIPEAEIDTVFGEFVQLGRPAERANSGFGLGLSICRRLVTALGGWISAQNLPEGGARFAVRLPAAIESGAVESDPLSGKSVG